MNNPESIAIIKRFYEAIDMLIANGTLRGRQTFTNQYKINRWNFITVSKNPESDMFQLIWISHLINDFGISAEWVMTGRGGMFAKKDISIIKKDNNVITLKELRQFDNKRCKVTYVPNTRKHTCSGMVTILFNSVINEVTIKINTESKLPITVNAKDILSIEFVN